MHCTRLAVSGTTGEKGDPKTHSACVFGGGDTDTRSGTAPPEGCTSILLRPLRHSANIDGAVELSTLAPFIGVST